MKHLSLLLGITASFVVPLAARAEPNPPVSRSTATRAKARHERVIVSAPAPPAKQPPKVRYEITRMVVAGSHLPVVVYHYQGEAFTGGNSFAPRKAYRREGGSLDTTGSANVAGELASLDPAFH